MKPDFSDLYSQLGLRPDCSLEDLKRAYHRRVARLHPDRPDAESTATWELPLADLMALYGAATRFHRHYGRLPGATSKPSGARPGAPRRRQIQLGFAPRETRSMLFQPGLTLMAIAVGLAVGLGTAWDWSIEGWLQRTMQRRTTAPTNTKQPPVAPIVATARADTIASAMAQMQLDWKIEGLLGPPASAQTTKTSPSPVRSADADCLLRTAPPPRAHH